MSSLINSFWTSPCTDSDASAFVLAVGTLDATETAAICTLVDSLKSDGIWSKLNAIYPIIGGTASAHKWNLKDPRDLDAAYRLTFVSTVTHDSNGMVGDGSTGYANTHLNALSDLTNSDLSLSFYSRTKTTDNNYSNEITVDEAVYSSTSWISFRVNNKTAGNAYFSAGDDNVAATVSSTLGEGFFVGNEIADNDRKLYRNGSQIASNTTSDTNALINADVCILGSFGHPKSTNQCAFASIGEGLTTQNITDFNTAVTTFQTSLGRNV